MTIVYTDNDPFVCQWLRNLETAGELPAGQVIEGDIRSIEARDVKGATQAHFFAGVGGLPLALQLAGWPDDVPVWTGSCPCQPFSTAGRRKGFDDERHLWPTWFSLIERCKPPIIFGEQVASPDGLDWLDAVSADLERAGYEVGASDLCAAGIGAPHLRQRLYWVAVARGERRERLRLHLRARRSQPPVPQARRSGEAQLVADTASAGRRRSRSTGETEHATEVSVEPRRSSGSRGADARIVGDSGGSGSGRDTGEVSGEEARGEPQRFFPRRLSHESVPPGAVRGFWAGADWIACYDPRTDGVVYRPVEPGVEPLAPRLPGDVGRLRAYGNAVVVPLATTFVQAVMEVLCET